MLAALPFPDISPDLFTVSLGAMTFSLRWYALAYIAGLLIGWRIVVYAVRRPRLWPADTPPLTAAQVEDLLFWIILGVVIGGRLGFVLFYQPAYFAQNPAEILKVWQGGMSFHGGFAGVIVATLLFCRRNAAPFLSVTDSLALAAPPGLLLGRLANFINGELWGRPTDVPWAVVFPMPQAQDCPGIAGICARHPSQLYEAALEGLLLGGVLLALAFATGLLRHPGRAAGVFLTGYGLARFLVELVRQPDAQFMSPDNPVGYALQLGSFGLTMGQILSLPMIALGVWLILRVSPSTRPA
ncbi:Prolipoprotein diacylglyceryl transferase [Poseidonocella pacifica]|uniref:Phosphatidylglycerol--prolipoprotein diacylglyceryl transferase n=1 Tax=Poseidonocella pacifica TaxID=871651 RepID=A0A1I0XD78_9RHOB|nr:prolipoprotein diacylglyceryl transferase [Poseidonocella pacifica]SFA98982.1 Prolipoprotein diacylglyceryl transferase [Poseidonocella pacifica]